MWCCVPRQREIRAGGFLCVKHNGYAEGGGSGTCFGIRGSYALSRGKSLGTKRCQCITRIRLIIEQPILTNPHSLQAATGSALHKALDRLHTHRLLRSPPLRCWKPLCRRYITPCLSAPSILQSLPPPPHHHYAPTNPAHHRYRNQRIPRLLRRTRERPTASGPHRWV